MCKEMRTMNEEYCGSKSCGNKGCGNESSGAESPVCRYEMELSFAIVILIMMTLQPLLGSVLWNLWYDLR